MHLVHCTIISCAVEALFSLKMAIQKRKGFPFPLINSRYNDRQAIKKANPYEIKRFTDF